MIAISLALGAALAYGLSDFVGGVTAKRATPWAVGVVGQCVGAAVLALVALLVGGHPDAGDLAWALVAGAGTGFGVAFLYRGLAAGRMGVVAPISGVGAALVPVIVGVASGERPSVVVTIGLVAALPGIWLVARQPGADSSSTGVWDGVLAGAGFGVLFAGLAQVDDDAGLLPVALAQFIGALVIVVVASTLHASWRPTRGASGGVVTGLLGSTAVAMFTIATHHGFLTVVAVIASLYPAATIVLAATVLRERVHPAQAVGLVLCGAAVSLVAWG